MTLVSRLKIDHPPLDDPGGGALHSQVEDNFIDIGDSISSRYYEAIAIANGATVAFDHNYKMPFDELTFVVYNLAGAGGELTVADQADYAIAATSGSETTSVDVTNNTGGVSTFAVIAQSIGGASAGGQSPYTVIVDAAGGGDYTDIRSAVLAETNGAVIYVLDGVYNETSQINLVENQKIIGQSFGGVKVNFTVSTCFRFANNWVKRTETQRGTNNFGWDASGGLGTLSVTNNSTIVTYTGSGTNPVANDILLIGANFYSAIQSVDTGLKQITMASPWGGATISGIDGFVCRNINTPADLDDWTMVKNLVVTCTSTSGKCFELNGSYGFWAENIIYNASNTGFTTQGLLFYTSSNARHRHHNLSYRGSHGTGARALYFAGSVIDVQAKNLEVTNSKFNQMSHGTSTPMKYCNFHFSLVDGVASLFYLSHNGLYGVIHTIDLMTNCGGGFRQDPGGTNDELAKCVFKFGVVNGAGSGQFSFIGYDNIVDLGINDSTGTIKLEQQSGSGNPVNMLMGGVLECGSLSVDGTVVISGAVSYPSGSLSGVPGQNNGHDK